MYVKVFGFERVNWREGENERREIEGRVEEVSEESGESSREGWVVVENYVWDFLFRSFCYGFQRRIWAEAPPNYGSQRWGIVRISEQKR